jgi:glutathione peroxidase
MMKRLFPLLLALMSLSASAKSIYSLKVKNAEGKEVSLKKYRGQVLLIVNTATHCGFTPQYKELQQIYDRYSKQGFQVLDFPCNQFGQQAPGSMGEIRQFCTEKFQTTFPLFEKIEVNGTDESPLFTLLKKEQPFRGFDLKERTGQMMDQMLRRQDPKYDQKSDIKWNFTKFLVDGKGQVIRRFEPTESMSSVEEAVKKALK